MTSSLQEFHIKKKEFHILEERQSSKQNYFLGQMLLSYNGFLHLSNPEILSRALTQKLTLLYTYGILNLLLYVQNVCVYRYAHLLCI